MNPVFITGYFYKNDAKINLLFEISNKITEKMFNLLQMINFLNRWR